MRRVWLILLLALLLSGCAELRQERAVVETINMAPAAVPAQNFPQETATVARFQARGALVVGVRYDLEPFSYITAENVLMGLEVDLAREFAKRWLGDSQAVTFIQVRSDTALHHLQTGAVDFVLAGLTHTQQADAQADFSEPYFINGQALLTFPELGVQSVNDIQGRPVGVVGWTGSRTALQTTAPFTLTLSSYNNFFEVVEALRTRQVQTYGDMRHRLARAQRQLPGTVIVGQYTWEPVAVAYRQNDPFFANLLNFTLQDMRADGTLAALYTTWLPGLAPPPVPLWPGSASAPLLEQAPPQLSTVDTIANISAGQVLTVGYIVDRWPYTADRTDGTQTGFEIRLLERVAERWLGNRQALRLVPVTAQDGLQRLARGEVHLLAGGWLRTRESELRADFSIAIYDDGVSLLSLVNTPVATPTDLGGKHIGIVAGSAGEAALSLVLQHYGVGLSAVTYPDITAALLGLRQGEVGAIMAERQLLLYPRYFETGFTLSDARFTYRPVAWAMAEGDSDFHDLVNHTLATLESTGVYQEFYEAWFGDPLPTLDTRPGSPIRPLIIE